MALRRMWCQMRRAKGKQRPVLGVQRAMASKKERGKAASAEKPAGRAETRTATRPPSIEERVQAGTIKRGTRAQAIEIILADAVADGEGFSFGAVGSPRYGKTHFLKAVLDAARTKGICERVLVHDTKKAGAPQYDGAPCASLDAFIASGARYDVEPVVVFNGPDWMHQPTVQEVCEVGVAVHDEGFAVAVVADEVLKATDGFQGWLKGADGADGRPAPALFPLFMREGGSQRISTLWTTQIPQELPRTCQVLTRAVAQFHLESLAADAATEKFRLDADGPRVLRTLRRGEFVLFCQGQEWNRTIYGPT